MDRLYEAVSSLIVTVSNFVWGWPEQLPLLVVLLVGTGLVTTFRLGWIQVRYFRHGVRVIRGEYDDPEHEGDLSHFQALSTALSATIGIGNIAGVATAIHYGGPGALFWMWVTAVFGMALKYTECTLAMKYRIILPGGNAAGGPMYSIEKGLGRSWKPLAVAFAAFAVISSFGSGNAVQSFTVADQFRQDLGLPTWITGLVMASLVALVILGGIRRIGRVTSKLVPFMCVFYIVSAMLVLAVNIEHVPSTLALIFSSAFQPAAQIGGFAGGTFVFMLTWGVKRGLFSNESGQGSAPIAHAAARTDEPIREGMVAMLGPFIDTLVVCTMTGLVILITGVWTDKQEQQIVVNEQAAIVAVTAGAEVGVNGTVATSDLATGRLAVVDGRPQGFSLIRNHAVVDEPVLLVSANAVVVSSPTPFDGVLELPTGAEGNLNQAILEGADGRPVSGALVLRGRASQNGSPLTAWAFQRGLGRFAGGQGHLLVTVAVFLFGLSTAISWSYYGDRSILYLAGPRWVLPYRIAFCIAHFLGAVYSLELVWAFGDLALGLMTIPNLISILLLTGVLKGWTREYVAAGKLEPPAGLAERTRGAARRPKV
ncbi:MAG: alanine:cation symporter family protein [Thermoanaerobaculales bacterium]|nr:alanine:cation symporter family protein [Thermoanaerobaculales bacterium]